MTERRWHDDVPGYGRRYHREVIQEDGTIETTTLIPVLTLARMARTGEDQVYERVETVVLPSTAEEVAGTEAIVAEILEAMGSSGRRTTKETRDDEADEWER